MVTKEGIKQDLRLIDWMMGNTESALRVPYGIPHLKCKKPGKCLEFTRGNRGNLYIQIEREHHDIEYLHRDQAQIILDMLINFLKKNQEKIEFWIIEELKQKSIKNLDNLESQNRKEIEWIYKKIENIRKSKGD